MSVKDDDIVAEFGLKSSDLYATGLNNGACGDINNVNVLGNFRPKNDRYQHTARVAALVAAASLWAWNEMTFVGDVPLGAEMEEVVLKRRARPSEADLARVREIEAQKNSTMGERAFVRRVLRRMADVPKDVPTWVQVLRIGDLGLVGVPGELLVELGLEIKQHSPFGHTMVLELANDSVGYLPNRRTFEEGGYEPEASLFCPGVGEQIVNTALKLLNRLHNSQPRLDR